jgi:hypothetical protein
MEHYDSEGGLSSLERPTRAQFGFFVGVIFATVGGLVTYAIVYAAWLMT